MTTVYYTGCADCGTPLGVFGECPNEDQHVEVVAGTRALPYSALAEDQGAVTTDDTTGKHRAVVEGDFFYSSWGYDQTNVDFYKVVGLTKSGKSVRVQQWSTARVGGEMSADYVVPGEGPAMVSDWSAVTEDMDHWEQVAVRKDVPAEVRTHRLKFGGYCGAAFTLNSYSGAWLWDGKPKYRTASGWGH